MEIFDPSYQELLRIGTRLTGKLGRLWRRGPGTVAAWRLCFGKPSVINKSIGDGTYISIPPLVPHSP